MSNQEWSVHSPGRVSGQTVGVKDTVSAGVSVCLTRNGDTHLVRVTTQVGSMNSKAHRVSAQLKGSYRTVQERSVLSPGRVRGQSESVKGTSVSW